MYGVGYLIENILIDKINKKKKDGDPKSRWIDVVKNLLIIDQNTSLKTAYQRDSWQC
jgi:hypothetical protein